ALPILIKLAVATLLKDDLYFSFTGKKMDGWPEFEQLKDFDMTQKEGEQLIKTRIIHYFDALND
ncbi:MAG TPA: hypothetical protein DCQ58_05610, partial [Saprospirales bacterium]|nr:hypothetical protein [Saprospirales bacterium]